MVANATAKTVCPIANLINLIAHLVVLLTIRHRAVCKSVGPMLEALMIQSPIHSACWPLHHGTDYADLWLLAAASNCWCLPSTVRLTCFNVGLTWLFSMYCNYSLFHALFASWSVRLTFNSAIVSWFRPCRIMWWLALIPFASESISCRICCGNYCATVILFIKN